MIEGTTVIEVGNGLPIWHAGALLRGLGADVARVVPRRELPILDADRPSQAILNRGKRLIHGDLRLEADRQRLLEDLRTADVLLSGIRPRTAHAWGLTAEQLHDEAPTLVVVSLTAFGPKGPAAEIAGHDLNATAITGVLAMETAPDTPAGDAPYETPMADLAAALFCVIGVLAGLRARDSGARATPSCDVSLAQASLALVAAWAPAALSSSRAPRFQSPWYGVYPSRDGVALAVGALEMWQREWLIDDAGFGPRRPTEVDRTTVARIIAARTAADWLERSRSAGVALSVVRQPADVLDDEQVAETLSAGLVRDDPWRRVLIPFGVESFEDCVPVDGGELRSRLFDQGS